MAGKKVVFTQPELGNEKQADGRHLRNVTETSVERERPSPNLPHSEQRESRERSFDDVEGRQRDESTERRFDQDVDE